jgi:DNA-binding transcriptional MocR family regulator
MTRLLQTGQLQAHIAQTLQPAYAARYHTLLRAITTHLLPLGFTLPRADRDVAGGFFLWLGLPEGFAAGDFARVCAEAEKGVIVAPGAMFEVPGDRSVAFDRNVRLCFAWESEENLEEGVKRMGDVAERFLVDGGRRVEGEYVFVDSGDVRGVEDFK